MTFYIDYMLQCFEILHHATTWPATPPTNVPVPQQCTNAPQHSSWSVWYVSGIGSYQKARANGLLYIWCTLHRQPYYQTGYFVFTVAEVLSWSIRMYCVHRLRCFNDVLLCVCFYWQTVFHGTRWRWCWSWCPSNFPFISGQFVSYTVSWFVAVTVSSLCLMSSSCRELV